MKVRVEIDKSLTEKEIVINSPVYDDEVAQLVQKLTEADEGKTKLAFYFFGVTQTCLVESPSKLRTTL